MQASAIEPNVAVHHDGSLGGGLRRVAQGIGDRLTHPHSPPVGVGRALLVDPHRPA
jgi:hypothetical protein